MTSWLMACGTMHKRTHSSNEPPEVGVNSTTTSTGSTGRRRNEAAQANRGTSYEPVRFTLDNGLRVVIEENHAAKVVALEAWVDVGSATEPVELAGIAHVFEHMLFKGTKRRAVGEIARDVEGAGGDINAWTSFDETVYHLVLPSRHLELGLDILADTLQHSQFDAIELERELKVVLEELKQGEDNPGRVASQALFSTAYQKHPYRRPVIGTRRTVKSLTRERLLDFFHKNYVAKNITLVLCGDLDARRGRALVEKLFGKMTAGERRQTEIAVEPPQRAPRAKVVTADVREAQVQLAFHVPEVKHEDAPALEVLALVLGYGESSRLDKILRRDREVVNEAYAYAYAPRDPGLFVLGATCKPGEIQPALDGLLDQALRLAREPVTDEELARARAALEADGVYQKETMQGRARKLGYFESLGGSALEAVYLRAVASLRPGDLQRVAAKYFTTDNLSVVALAPPNGAPTTEKLLARLLPAEKRAGKPQLIADRTGAVHVTLPSGVRLIVVPDSGSGVVAMRAVFIGGQRYEDARRSGISNMVAGLLNRGTRDKTGDEIAREVEGMAGSLGGFSGRNTMGIAGEFLAANAERGLALLAGCLLTPSFREDELELERRRLLEQIRTETDQPGSVAFRLFHEAMFPRHPYRMQIIGDAASVASFTRRSLVDWHQRWLQLSQMVLTITGDVDPEKIVAAASALFPPSKTRLVDAPKPAVEQPFEDGPREVFHDLDKRQAHVVYGFPGTRIDSPDRHVLELVSTVLGGQSGRLFLELRDKKGLAYRVSASSVEGIDPGYFAVYIATSPENVQVAIAGIEDELDKLRKKPVSKDELDRAKRYLIGAHDISLQRRAALAATIAFETVYGQGSDAHEHYAEVIEAITPAEVQRAAITYFDRRRAVIATVRPEEKTPAVGKGAAKAAAAAHRKR